MTSSLPNRPLWPRSGRSGSRAAAASSSSSDTAAADGPASAAEGSDGADVRPKPTGRSGIAALLGERSKAFHPLEDPALALVEASLDVRREEEAPAGRADPERDRDGELRLVADRDRDAAHAQLLGPRGCPTVEAHGGLAGRQPLD